MRSKPELLANSRADRMIVSRRSIRVPEDGRDDTG
jgi:hypothetical protein